MNSKVPKKKLDFFNGGRGVNLSLYESEEYQDDSSSQSPAEHSDKSEPEQDPIAAANLGEPMSLSPVPSPYSPSQLHHHQSFAPSPPPYSHPHSNYPSSATSYYPTYCPIEGQGHSTPHSPCGISPHIHSGPLSMTQHTSTHLSTHISGTVAGPFPGPSVFADPHYATNFINHGGYAPLRPMEANGFHGVGVCYANPGAREGDSRLESSAGGSKKDESRKKKRQQKCSLCCNHGIHIDVKGHKWFCPYRNCDCDRCTITRGRQHHMKEQQKLTRHLQRLQ